MGIRVGDAISGLSLRVLDNLSRLQGNLGDALYTQTRALSWRVGGGAGRHSMVEAERRIL